MIALTAQDDPNFGLTVFSPTLRPQSAACRLGPFIIEMLARSVLFGGSMKFA
jgi:hypothetical protein